jgi:hypothetical protein
LFGPNILRLTPGCIANGGRFFPSNQLLVTPS